MNPTLPAAEISARIQEHLRQISLPAEPEQLYEPIRYILNLGGKRLRPLLALMSHNLFSDDLSAVMMPALSIEVFHNFTLVHDDIMDEAPLRRGQSTVHKKWNDNVAILSGDTMLVKAYELLAMAPPEKLKPLLNAFNQTATGVCEGQQLDMDFESRSLEDNPVTEAEYMNMIRLKTSVLFGFSLQMGGITGSGDAQIAQTLYEAGVHLGLAFQLQDDLLDLYGGEKFGKLVGGDILNAKKTYLLVKALELANPQHRQEIIALMKDHAIGNSEKIADIKDIYNHYQIASIAQEKVEKHLADFRDSLLKINSARTANLLSFVADLAHRAI